ncbi:MAG: hypothetical protein AAB436_01835 [Patescibacteria group bacterium]
MSKTTQNILITVAIISPLLFGLIASLNGLIVVIGAVLGIPIIAARGLIISFLKRNTPNYPAVIGYTIPALVVCTWMILAS